MTDDILHLAGRPVPRRDDTRNVEGCEAARRRLADARERFADKAASRDWRRLRLVDSDGGAT